MKSALKLIWNSVKGTVEMSKDQSKSSTDSGSIDLLNPSNVSLKLLAFALYGHHVYRHNL